MEHDLSLQVIPDLDVFLVLVSRLVDRIVALGLEEEVPDLAAHHRHQPGDQGRGHGIGEQSHVGGEETEGAHQVQRLVDAAVVIVPMIVPTLCTQSL
jgi:hypothetical protein